MTAMPHPIAMEHECTSFDSGWQEVLATMDVALQPIVNIHSGACYGYEALLRGYQAAGFDSPQDVFDIAHDLGALAEVELTVRAMALAKFARLPNRDQAKLFINIDNRTLSPDVDLHTPTRALLESHGLAEISVVFEISERHPLGQPADTLPALQAFRHNNFRLAIDDFGTGFSGLQMLYFAEPDFLKIDRFFVSDIANDSRKKLFLAQIVAIAHLLGVVVLAEGVENEREYFVCKEIGCDLVQGYLVQVPTTEPAALLASYADIAVLSRSDRRIPASDQRLIAEQITPIEPLPLDSPMEEVFDRFRADKARTFFPVVDAAGEPVGLVREQELKEYTYSRFGQALITRRRLTDFVVRCPVADINTKAETILQAYSTVEAGEGIIIADSLKYVGFLSAHSLIRVLNEKSLASAREQNPLTKLPGNNAIHQYLSQALDEVAVEHVVAYFDFDNFKPFNDHYGFRLGDRAILLFAELMAKALPRTGCFTGHVGGDDFFAGFRAMPVDECVTAITTLVERFGHEVETFYDEATRQRGWLDGHDRAGNPTRFPLLGVSAALIYLPRGRSALPTDDLSHRLAELKKQAKAAPTRVAMSALVL